MNVISAEKGKLVTNFIIIAAPVSKAGSEVVLPPMTERLKGGLSEE